MNPVSTATESPLLDAPVQVATTEITTGPAHSGQASPGSLPCVGSSANAAPRKRQRPWGKLAILVSLAVLGSAAALRAPTRDRIHAAFSRLVKQLHPERTEPTEAVGQSPPRPIPRWDGLIELTTAQTRAIGLELAEVRPQTEPTRLEINGTTAYDPNTQVQIRPRFTSVIDKVYVNLGQKVKEGDPLVDLFSADLAATKSEYEKAQARWEHDRTELDRAERLFKTKPPAISEKEFLAMVNDEKVSRADAKVAADKLLVYGVPEEALANVANEVGTEKAKMTLLARSDGVVIRKDVVRGNRYNETDVLMVIAPLDVFWVWGNVYPSDATRVEIGQRWVVRSPLLEKEVTSLIASITSEIARDTKTLRIRTEIPNIDGRLKADLLVNGYLELPPLPGRFVIPRPSLVSTDGADYVFVARPQADKNGPPSFERREVQVAEEHHDRVIIAHGLKDGEIVATRGSLLLEQVYEDAMTVEPGAPLVSVATP